MLLFLKNIKLVIGSKFALCQTTEAVVPGSNPRHISQWKTLRTGRVTVYTVKSRGRDGDLPLRPKTKVCFENYNYFCV